MEELSDRVAELLAQRGPLSSLAIAGLLATAEERIFTATETDPRFLWSSGGLHLTSRVLDGKCFVTELVDGGTVDPYPDLAALIWLFRNEMVVQADGRHRVSEDPDVGLIGPPGWLPEAPGALSFEVADAAHAVVRVFAPHARRPIDEMSVARVRSVIEELEAEDVEEWEGFAAGVSAVRLATTLARDHGALFAGPGPTLTELIDAAGYQMRNRRYIISKEADPNARPQFLDDDYRDDELLDPAVRRVEELIANAPLEVDDIADLLMDDAVSEAMSGLGVLATDRLSVAAEAVLAEHEDHPGALHARASVSLARGDVDAAERDLERASAFGGTVDALEKLADLRSERGDAAGALRLYRRSGLRGEEDPYIVRLCAMQGRPSAVGRNDPCPCGSGRKYKRCCGNSDALRPLSERVGWLRDKLSAFAAEARHDELTTDLFDRVAGWRASSGLIERFVDDAVLFEPVMPVGPLIERFIAERGHRLPADERALLDEWRASRFQLVEVVDGDVSGRIDLRIIGSEEHVTIIDHSASTELGPTDIGLVRLLPDGGSLRLMYALRIPRLKRSLVGNALRRGVVELGCALVELDTPSGPTNTDGQALIFCRRVWKVRDDALRALGERFERTDDATWQWLDVRDTVLATFALEKDELRVETNSVERMEAAAVLVGDVLMELVVSEEQNLDDVGRSSDRTHLREAPPPDAQHALGEFIAEREVAWLDESLPALEGLTPRQAWGDPEHRIDVEELLRDLEVIDRTRRGGFDVSRLRELLGK